MARRLAVIPSAFADTKPAKASLSIDQSALSAEAAGAAASRRERSK